MHAARVIGRCAPTTGIAPFGELVEQVMTTRALRRRGECSGSWTTAPRTTAHASIARMRTAWPTAELVHLPIHASWLNQVEIYFSIVQRKVIKPGDFADLPALTERLLAFQDRYNATAEPFDWHFTRTDLPALLDRMDMPDPTTNPTAHDPDEPASRTTSSSIGNRPAVCTRDNERGGVRFVDQQPLGADGLHPGADHAAELGEPQRPERGDPQRRPRRTLGDDSAIGRRRLHPFSMPATWRDGVAATAGQEGIRAPEG